MKCTHMIGNILIELEEGTIRELIQSLMLLEPYRLVTVVNQDGESVTVTKVELKNRERVYIS